MRTEAMQTIQIPEIAELENPIKVLLGHLRIDIINQSYSLLIADDRGGRLPALVLRRVINNFYRSRSIQEIPIIFIQGTRSNPPLMEESLKQRSHLLKRVDLRKKTLLVTDFIDSGATIIHFAELLSRKGIKFDVAAVAVKKHFGEYREGKMLLSNTDIKFFHGPAIEGIPGIDSRSRLSGLHLGDLEPRVISGSSFPELRQDVLQAREDVITLSKKLEGSI